MIVKIQRPLSISEVNPPALVYSRGRTFQRMIPMSPVIEAALGKETKVYCEASLLNGELALGQRVGHQEW